MAPAMLPVPRRPAGQPPPLPRRRRQARLLAQGRARRTRPTGSPAGTTTTPARARPSSTSSLDSPAALAWVANYGAVELHPWTSTVARPAPADVGDDRHRPRHASTFDDVLVLARLYRTALEHLGVQAAPKVTGKRGIQIWVPVAERLHVRRHPGLGRGDLAGDRRHRARAGELGVGGRQARRAGPGSTTPRTRSTRRWSRRSAPGRRRARRCRCRSPGTSSTTRTCAPTAGRSAPSAERLADAGDPLAPLGRAAAAPPQALSPLDDASVLISSDIEEVEGARHPDPRRARRRRGGDRRKGP